MLESFISEVLHFVVCSSIFGVLVPDGAASEEWCKGVMLSLDLLLSDQALALQSCKPKST